MCRSLAGELGEDSWVYQNGTDDWIAAGDIEWLMFAGDSDSDSGKLALQFLFVDIYICVCICI